MSPEKIIPVIQCDDDRAVVICEKERMDNDEESEEWALAVSSRIPDLGTRLLLIDLGKVVFITSRVLGCLIMIKTVANKQGIKFGMFALNQNLQDTLFVTNLERYLPFGEDMADIVSKLDDPNFPIA